MTSIDAILRVIGTLHILAVFLTFGLMDAHGFSRRKPPGNNDTCDRICVLACWVLFVL